MNIFRDPPNIEFFSLIPDIVDIAPIEPAYKFRPDLLNNSAKQLSIDKKEESYGQKKTISTAKCPGIYNLSGHGWILTTHQDITITTNGDMQSFEWTSAIDQRKMEGGDLVGEAVGSHPAVQYADFVGGKIPNSLSMVIKFHTPWRCVVPEGYYLQEGPVPYTDEKRFTTVRGFFSREYGVAQMNVQVLWHVLNGTSVIKAGTPIAHYMLIPKKQPKLIVRAATPKDLKYDRITNLELSRKFISSRDRKSVV